MATEPVNSHSAPNHGHHSHGHGNDAGHGSAHGHSHAPGHHHHHHAGSNIALAFWLNLSFTIIEFIGGWLTNSLAITSDALHDLGDSVALGMAWKLEHYAGKAANERYSYGHRRFSLLGALINTVVLIAGGLFILSEAIPRLLHPETVHAPGMLALAVLGVAVNGFAAFRMRHEQTLNAKVLAWHLYEDLLGWVAVLIVSAVMMVKPMPILDPILSVLITLYVSYNVVKNLRRTLALFLQAVPEELSLPEIEQQLCAIPQVLSCHHTHLWSLDGERHVLTTHLIVAEATDIHQIGTIKQVVHALAHQHGLAHTTIEIEQEGVHCSMAQFHT
ncbi:cation transporter [Permianibacter sp. IMCC34836]|uniref:cation diffusion facilitator family transporter n=1 Tax=Permianibacter fluminis TaxID=2738515 RepID=UPI001553FBC9|nr:cation diffusion facilitator family transporter [Permianibacter fluminis]NQD36463.1 cation transporter [Permianibacter fluminis]